MKISRVWFYSILLVVLIAVGLVSYYNNLLQPFGVYRPSNAIVVVAPYRYQGDWVFDDARAGLVREPFVSGIPEMIDEMVKDIPDARNGFRLLFSAQPFPGYTHKLVWRRGDATGNWYYSEQLKKEGWLCPSLFLYYKHAPKEIYVKAERKKE